jgi:hypothetical protein
MAQRIITPSSSKGLSPTVVSAIVSCRVTVSRVQQWPVYLPMMTLEPCEGDGTDRLHTGCVTRGRSQLRTHSLHQVTYLQINAYPRSKPLIRAFPPSSRSSSSRVTHDLSSGRLARAALLPQAPSKGAYQAPPSPCEAVYLLPNHCGSSGMCLKYTCGWCPPQPRVL